MAVCPSFSQLDERMLIHDISEEPTSPSGNGFACLVMAWKVDRAKTKYGPEIAMDSLPETERSGCEGLIFDHALSHSWENDDAEAKTQKMGPGCQMGCHDRQMPRVRAKSLPRGRRESRKVVRSSEPRRSRRSRLPEVQRGFLFFCSHPEN